MSLRYADLSGAKKWQEYCEADDEGPKRTSRNLEDDDLLPLPENVLSTNYGLDIVVAITKVIGMKFKNCFTNLRVLIDKYFLADRLYVNFRKRIRLSRRAF